MPIIAVFVVSMLLIAALLPWRDELGAFYVYYALTILGLMILLVVALGARSIVRMIKIYRQRDQGDARTRQSRSTPG